MKTYHKFRTEFRPIGVFKNEDVCFNLKFLNVSMLFTRENFFGLPKAFENIANIPQCPIKVMKSS